MANEHPARRLFADALTGRIDRRSVIRRAVALGLSAPVVAALGQASLRGALAQSQEGTLSVTYYDWILNLHSPIEQHDEEFRQSTPLEVEVAPSAGFSTDIFFTEARDQTSTYDLYIGVTPFLEMIQLAEGGVIEPWNEYVSPELIADITPAIREEGTYNGQFYVWPFLLDVIVQGWNSDLVTKAGLDPETPPATWDEFLANARKIRESGVAPFGCTFDFHAWRSLLPITHSISTDVYNPDGTFMWTSDAAVQALEIMKQMTELANPDVLNEGTTDAGVNQTPDEQAFASQAAAYYIKYQNAHLRFAGTWPDPSQLRLAALPKAEGGAGGTVFWDTGAVLLRHGKNKAQAAQYMEKLTKDQRVWEHSVTGAPPEETAVGQLPVYQSIWNEYRANRPAWMTDWAFAIYDGLANARAIAPTRLSVSQFNLAAPHYVRYLKGETDDARAALQACQDAVAAEMQKTQGAPTATA